MLTPSLVRTTGQHRHVRDISPNPTPSYKPSFQAAGLQTQAKVPSWLIIAAVDCITKMII